MKPVRLVRLILVASFLCLAGAASAHASGAAALSDCSSANRTLTATDGSLITIGQTWDCSTPSVRKDVFVKLNADGSIDSSWSDGGFRVLGGGEFIRGAELDSDDRLTFATATTVFRLLPDGSPDPDFGTAGQVEDLPGLLGSQIGGLKLGSDGRTTLQATRFPESIRLLRLDANGELDSGFGSGGIASPSHPAPGFRAFNFTVDSSGRTIIIGRDGDRAAALRLLADGQPDTEFGPDADGYSVALPSGDYWTGYLYYSVTVGDDGLIRIYQGGASAIYCQFSYQSTFDDDGVPVPEQSYSLGCGYSASIPIEGYVRAYASSDRGRGVPTLFGLSLADLELSQTIWRRDMFISPGSSGALGADYAAGSEQLTGSGFAIGGDCVSARCASRSHMAVVRVDAGSGSPLESFGTGGVALIPGNTCGYGTAPSAGSDQAWKRCRVAPPKVRGRAFLFGKRRPSLVAQVSLKRPPFKPGAMTQKVRITVPRSLRLKRPKALARMVRVKTLPFWRKGTLDVSVKGRVISFTFVRQLDESNPVDEDLLSNRELTFSVEVERGAFRSLRGKVGSKRFRVPVRAAYVPRGPATSPWYSSNFSKAKLRMVGRRYPGTK